MSIPKNHDKVGKSDMSVLENPNVKCHYAGLFENDGEWIHPQRTEVTYEIIYVTRGRVYLCEGGREYALGQGELLLLTPGVAHVGSRASRGVGFYWVHFSLDGEMPFAERYFPAFEHPSLFRELLHYLHLHDSPHYLVNAILLHILGELCHASGRAHLPASATAQKIYEWVRINASAGLLVSDIAARFGYSPDHITRLCQKHFGLGAAALVDRFLLERARSLLSNTELRVKEIAESLGFSDDKAFVAYFKYHEGIYPSAHRNRFGGIHMNRA